MKFGRFLYLLLFLLALSCRREEAPVLERVPDGEPVTMHIGFGSPSMLKVDIGTKAEASRPDEANVHDLYVMIFDGDGKRFYNRFFTYEHKTPLLTSLENNPNEGWWVENCEYDSENRVYTTTRGVVKVSTVSRRNCTLVVLANISNSITTLDGQQDVLDCLSEITTLEQLNRVKVTLRQEIVNRTDLFMMLGMTDATVDTGSSVWGRLSGDQPVYDGTKVQLNTLDAKVKFYVSLDGEEGYINPETSETRHWKVYNVPSSAYLVPQEQDPQNVNYFTSEDAFFEGTYRDENGKTWDVFTFYMLENRQSSKKNGSIEALSTPDYYLREKQDKLPDTVHSTPEETYVINGNWTYAPDRATYVKFDIVLGFTEKGIGSFKIDGKTDYDKNALSAEVRYTVHLGNFVSSNGISHDFDHYDVARGHAYSYFITVQNAGKVYVEVAGEDGDPDRIREDEPGQEGSLMLATTDLVNCDAHYEYHCMTFNYDKDLDPSLLSWYVKTPFGEGAAHYDRDHNDWVSTFNDDKWVMFRLNDVVDGEYSELRKAYPGIGAYDPSWTPDTPGPRPALMDIRQLVMYIFDQTLKKKDGEGNDFVNEKIRVTAFVDEYYYESDPILGTGEPDPDLWRKFVNAQPRELHILSKAKFSQDRQSTLVTSSHAIIQQSIQSFYNVYSPTLSSLWGTEHRDEMSYANRVKKNPEQADSVWPWWPAGRSLPEGTSVRPASEENGRMNTASLWGLYTSHDQHWTDADDNSYSGYLYYNVVNVVPELKDDNKYLAYSCLTRNRDNDGDGIIDPEELRWYTASVNQLVGMWVGAESLSKSVRLYQPLNAADKTDGLQWRSWVVSSTANSVSDPVIIRAEEAATRSDYSFYNWANFSATDRDKVSSVRCLRNVGTYQEGGATKDVTRAPYEYMVNQYYDFPAGTDGNGKVLPNEDGTYTIRFTNLNPKSVREYTENDLPFHDEYSVHNQVYLELNMQSTASLVVADGTGQGDEEVINKNITRLGYNPYCPDGYRLPSMTELLLMRALQPRDYWGNNTYYPCRTFFSRGKLGGNQTDSEDVKIGWSYNSRTDRVHLADAGDNLNGIRCVRDRNRTGDITGKITVDNSERLAIGNPATLNLNFTSVGSAITDIALALVFVSTDGLESTRPISVTPALELGSTSIRAQESWTVPDVPILGRMSVRATVRNAAGVVRVFETPVKLQSRVFTSVRLLHCEYDDVRRNPDFPVVLTASSPSADRPLSSVNLYIMDPSGDLQKVEIPVSGKRQYLSSVYYFRYDEETLQSGTYSFQLEAVTDNGSGHDQEATRSSIATMEILKHDYWPNTPADWETSADVTNLWDKQEVKNISFAGGDFIEANLDISHCTYKEVLKADGTRDDNLTLGRDILISVGLTDTDYSQGNIKVPYVYHITYPAHDGNATSGQDWLRANISTASGASNGINYKLFEGGAHSGFVKQGSQYKPDIQSMQHFRMDNGGVWWNDQLLDPDRWGSNAANAKASLAMLRGASTVYVGATQGIHRTRAGYLFVRVVRNNATENAAGGGVDLGGGPVHGGDL